MEENLKSASEWQGTDKYAGIDSYEEVVLKAGTEMCALVSYRNGEMCPCNYLFPKNALEIVKDDDVLLNQMLQIAPWRNPKTVLKITIAIDHTPYYKLYF
ncbi:MAG: hypothetical protein IK131_05255 [Paludibacteraceae bacterium]|nr:hypothetical protein [Paludibacteraceae bacterium]